MNYTKGEWQTYDGHDGQFYHEPYITIKPNAAQKKAPIPIARIVDCGTDESNRANAQLIALSPRMYELLKQLADWNAGKLGKESNVKIIEISKLASKIIAEIES